MATRYNPYALDPALSAGIGNLTKALIGSASDDAAIARGRASDALAGYRQAQTRGEDAKTDYLQSFNKNIASFLSNPEAVKSVYDTIGLTPPVQNIPRAANIGFDSGAVDPGIARAMGIDTNQQRNIPYIEKVGQEIPNDVMSGLVGAILKGGVPGNPQQTSNMGLNLQQMSRNALERNAILNSGQSLTGIARLLAGDTIGQNDEPGSSLQKTQLDIASDIKQKEMETTSKETIATKDREAEDAYKRFKVGQDNENNLEKQELINKTDKEVQVLKNEQAGKDAKTKAKIDKEIAELEAKTDKEVQGMKDKMVKYKHDNRTIELTVTPGQKITVDPTTGEKLGLTKNTDGLYVIDGGVDMNKVRVKVGKEDVFLTKQEAELLGIEKDENNQYKIKGAGYKDADIGEAKDFDSKYKNDFEAFADLENKLTPQQNGKIRAYLQRKVNDSNLPFDQAYNKFVMRVLTAGNIRIKPGGSNFNFPKFFFDSVTQRAGTTPKADLTNFIKSLGFDQSQAERVYKEATE